MTTVGIIAEYNPFHKGHAYHIEEIRKHYGSDTRIISVMSGNFPQRGDLAIADKYTRAEAAVAGGVDLVMELPFPFSGESAPIFADAGVQILSALGVVDVLSFGAACADTDRLLSAAHLSEESRLLARAHEEALHTSSGYPAAFHRVLMEELGEETASLFLDANNLLGMEYMKKCKKRNAKFTFFAVERKGVLHKEREARDGFVSSSHLRKLFFTNRDAAFFYLPEGVREIYASAMDTGRFPVSAESLYPAVAAFFARSPRISKTPIADAGGGLYERIASAAEGAKDLSSLLHSSKTKKYTNARIRRAIRNAVLGVSPDDTAAPPLYTTVLAMNRRGQSILHDARIPATISLVTKPADTGMLSSATQAQIHAAQAADRLYTAAFPTAHAADLFLKETPRILK